MKRQTSIYYDPQMRCRKFPKISIATTLPGLLACLYFGCTQPGQTQGLPFADNVQQPPAPSAASGISISSPSTGDVTISAPSADKGNAPTLIASNPAPAIIGAPIRIASAETPSGNYGGDDVLIHNPYDKDVFTMLPMRYWENAIGIRWTPSQTYKVNYAPLVTPSLADITALKKLGFTSPAQYGIQAPFLINKTTAPFQGKAAKTVTGFLSPQNPYTWTQTRSLRTVDVYWAATVGKHLSTYSEINANAYRPHKLFNGAMSRLQWESNWGSSHNNFMIRGGVVGNGRGIGFSDFDRATGSGSFLYTGANNGFANAGGKSVSVEYTGPHLSTTKVYYFHATGLVTSKDSSLKMGNNTGMGLTWEKVIGKEGLSGVQGIFEWNRTPGVYETKSALFPGDLITEIGHAGTNPKVKNAVITTVVQLPSYTGTYGYGAKTATDDKVLYAMANKTWQDRHGFIRMEASGGGGAWWNQRMVTQATQSFHNAGYGYFLQLLGYPVKGRVATYIRYDQYLPFNHVNTTKINGIPVSGIYAMGTGYDASANVVTYANGRGTPSRKDTQYAFTTGIAIDIPGPLRSHGKVNFDVQLLGQDTTGPHYTFNVGWVPLTVY